MMSTMMAIIDPGDEVVVFEPFYENYGPDAILSGATPRYVTLHEPDWPFDPDELAAAFNNKTRAIIINTPNNPTGKVFSREELETIAALCRKWDAVAISDEIYEHILYDGRQHVPIATIDGMAERTVTINGLSKTYSVTGWRVGWTISPPSLTGAIRKVHDFLTVGAPAPLQEAGAVALGMPDQYYRDLAAKYQRLRDMLLEILERHHFTCYKPYGAYYIMTDISALRFQRRCRVRALSGQGRRRGRRAGQQLLQEFRRTAEDQAAVLLLQAGRDDHRGRPPAGEARAGRRRAVEERHSALRPPRTQEARSGSTASRSRRLVSAAVSVARHDPEEQPLQLERSGVGLDDVADVERAVADLDADVVREVERAVDVDVEVVAAGVLDQLVRQLEAGDFAGNRDVAAPSRRGRCRRWPESAPWPA